MALKMRRFHSVGEIMVNATRQILQIVFSEKWTEAEVNGDFHMKILKKILLFLWHISLILTNQRIS